MRFRSVAVPFFFVTVNPIRIGPGSSRRRLCRMNAALFTRVPSATARKSARCRSRSMVGSPEPLGSGAQTLAAAGAAGGKNLAAAGGGEAGAEAVTALAHQFAGLIGPLHGFFLRWPGNLPVAGNLPVVVE